MSDTLIFANFLFFGPSAWAGQVRCGGCVGGGGDSPESNFKILHIEILAHGLRKNGRHAQIGTHFLLSKFCKGITLWSVYYSYMLSTRNTHIFSQLSSACCPNINFLNVIFFVLDPLLKIKMQIRDLSIQCCTVFFCWTRRQVPPFETSYKNDLGQKNGVTLNT